MCVGSYNEAIKALKNGADRIELCDNLLEGGTTPSYGTILKTIKKLDIPVMVIIRPRGGNFEFSNEEFEIMKEDIKICKDLGAYGVVIGALEGDKIAYDKVKELVEIAKPMSITFHMAFDEIKNRDEAIEQLIELSIDRILTKGGNTDAYSCMDEIKRLNSLANARIIIMPGKGINTENRDEILQKTNVSEIHGSKIL